MKKSMLTVAIVAAMLVSAGFVIAGDTIWTLENGPDPDDPTKELGVCSDCHTDVKKGHMDKKECDRCHEPGAKKEVHDVAVVFDGGDVNDPDVWEAWCSKCHTIKSGHMEQKKECLKCHGPGAKKDVHIEMPNEDCTSCHSKPTEGHAIDYAKAEGCEACHEYM